MIAQKEQTHQMREFFRALLILFLALAVALTLPSPKAASEASGFEVPMRFVGSMPAVEVMVNGKGPFLFGIDTGGQGAARIDSSLVQKLGLKSSGQIQASDSSGRNRQPLEMVRLESIEIGRLRFSDVQAATRDLKATPRLGELDGILTLNLFASYLFSLDFPSKMVRAEKGELPKPDGAEILSYTSLGGIPVVEIAFGDKKIPAHLDSGNAIGSFVVPAEFAAKLFFDGEPAVVGHARSMSGEFEIKEGRVMETVRLGRWEFPQPAVTFPALGDAANIGSKVLGEFILTFDQRSNRVRLLRKSDPGAK